MKKSRFEVILIQILALLFILLPVSSAKAQEDVDLIEELKLFSKAIGVILEGYVGDVTPRNLYYEAVKGMVSSLDKYCEFFGRDKYELLKIQMKGEYSGIGAKLETIGKFPGIGEMQPGSAAEKAGLLLHDEIRKIDGVSMENIALPDVAKLLRGEENTPLVLTIFRAPVKKLFDVKIVREKILIESVKDVRMIGKALGYLRIDEWQEKTTDQLGTALETLHKQGMKALIIDLRSNQGGIMPKAIEGAEKFLPNGSKLISVTSKIQEQRKEYISANPSPETDYPILILVNEASASASEIFTASLQDNGRARVLGVKTFGKASVQSVIPLDEYTAMKITTARYVSPKGRVIDHVGIEPDEVVTNGAPGTPGADQQTRRALEIFKDYV